jgi:hypothetical protein
MTDIRNLSSAPNAAFIKNAKSYLNGIHGTDSSDELVADERPKSVVLLAMAIERLERIEAPFADEASLETIKDLDAIIALNRLQPA